MRERMHACAHPCASVMYVRVCVVRRQACMSVYKCVVCTQVCVHERVSVGCVCVSGVLGQNEGLWVWVGWGAAGTPGVTLTLAALTSPGLPQKAPSASDSDSKAESDGAKAEPAAVARSASSSSCSSSSDSDASVKKPPRGRKPGRPAGGCCPGPAPGLAVGGELPPRDAGEATPPPLFHSREASPQAPWAETEG